MQQKASPTQNSLIQTSMYLNRLNNPNSANTTALTPEQQQQILFYQQQEIQNLQNLQAAAGHHHGSVPCHQAHHNINTPCLSQYHTSGRVARRTNQTGTNNTASKQTSTGKLVDRRGNSSLPTTPSVNDPKVSSYVDMQTEGNNDTALTVACVGGHAPLVGLLIQRGANVEHRDKKGFTPLILSATGGHVECCKLLLEAGCQVDAVSERTKDTALSLACSSGRKEVVELLLSYNANKEHRNVSDYTPLSLASSGGYVDIIHLLLDAGAEINSRTGSKLGISPLMLSAMNGHDHATLLLLERGSDINAQIETNRNTALTLACFQGRTEVVRLLLDYNANYEHRAKTGLTPLMEAANGGFTDVGALLLKSGADPNAPPVPTSRDTALTIAGLIFVLLYFMENNFS
jgi:ankyrin repeat domain-containing protein 17